MRRSKAELEEQAVSADLILMAQISVISLEIFSGICLAAEGAAVQIKAL